MNIAFSSEGQKRRLERFRCQREDNFEMDPTKIRWDDMSWINLALDREHWRASVSTVLNLPVPKIAGKFLNGRATSREGLSSAELTG
jgi:hypothetical protein